MTFNLSFSGLFSRKKTIKNINAEELRKERIGLDNEERRLEKDIRRLNDDDQMILSEYAAASNSGNQHQKRILARKIQDVRSQINTLDQRHSFLTKQMRVVSGLILIKENEAFFKRLGANSKLDSMDMVELQQYVEQATIDGELTSEKLETLATAMNEANAAYCESEADGGLGEFMTGLDNELEQQGVITTEETSTEDLDTAISALDRELSKPKSSTEHNSESQAK